MALISFTYLALPGRYHLKPDWQEAAAIVMITSVMVVFAATSWRKIAFWMSLGISSAVQLVIVHAWTRRIPNLSLGTSKSAAFLGLLLFLAVYAIVRFLQRMLYGTEAVERA